jgi:hypothetical protein
MFLGVILGAFIFVGQGEPVPADTLYSQLLSARSVQTAKNVVRDSLSQDQHHSRVATFVSQLSLEQIDALPRHSAEALMYGMGFLPADINSLTASLYPPSHRSPWEFLKSKKKTSQAGSTFDLGLKRLPDLNPQSLRRLIAVCSR